MGYRPRKSATEANAFQAQVPIREPIQAPVLTRVRHSFAACTEVPDRAAPPRECTPHSPERYLVAKAFAARVPVAKASVARTSAAGVPVAIFRAVMTPSDAAGVSRAPLEVASGEERSEDSRCSPVEYFALGRHRAEDAERAIVTRADFYGTAGPVDEDFATESHHAAAKL